MVAISTKSFTVRSNFAISGKIYVQEGILSKAGPLDDAEWVEMKQHTVVGAELLLKIPYLTQAIPIIRFHHERWDGSGYPLGLVGEEIPLGARIVSVADSFDAMTSARIYQKPVSKDTAQKLKMAAGPNMIPRWSMLLSPPGTG